MTDKHLLNRVAKLGLPLFEPEDYFNVNETLAQVVKSQETRLWEGFPVLLVNAADDYSFSLNQVKGMLNSEQQRHLQQLVLLSLALYSVHNLTPPWAVSLQKELDLDDKARVKKWRNELAQDQKVTWDHFEFDPQRLKNAFGSYFERTGEKSRRRMDKYDEYSLEHALSQLFSPKQKELFKKKLDGLPMTKTENEYYSRTVRKKVVAMANSELHTLARKLLEL